MRKKKIEIPLYSGTVTIIQTNNFKKIAKKYGFQSLKGYDGCMFRNPKKNGYSRYVIVFQKIASPSVIAHECLHFVNYLFEDSNIILDIKNDEPQCYLLDWIVGECHKFLNIDQKS
jgi:hypothetical protein